MASANIGASSTEMLRLTVCEPAPTSREGLTADKAISADMRIMSSAYYRERARRRLAGLAVRRLPEWTAN